MKDDILIGDTPKALKRRGRLKKLSASGRLWKHSKLTDIAGLVTDENIADYFVVTFVRNPWDRLVSYYFWLREQTFDHPAVTLSKEHDFSEFLSHPQTLRSIGAEGYSDYVQDSRGVERCSLFVRVENIAEDIAPFEKHLGFKITPLQRVNMSPRDRDYRGYYSGDDAHLVGSLFASDIRRFDYKY